MRTLDYDRIEKEIHAYDAMAVDRSRAEVGEFTRNSVGPALVARFLEGEVPRGFPRPIPLWLDSIANPVTQLAAYDWLSPIDDRLFMQMGGAGSHAIKALIAGARRAVLITPSTEEGNFARSMAEHLGISRDLDVVIGIGEGLPIASDSVDRVFGGGTLHHIHLEQGLTELSRVLKPRGRAGFVEPRLNFVYRFFEFTRLRELVREKGSHCYPLDLSDVASVAVSNNFSRVEYNLAGGPARYVIVGLTRALNLRIPLSLSLMIQQIETRALNALQLRSMLGGMAVLLQK